MMLGLIAAAASALAADPAPRVPVEPFFRHADYGSFKISPSGKYVAGIVPVNGRGGLVAIDLDTRKPGHATTVNVSDIGWFEWVNDDRLVFTVIDLQTGGGMQRGTGLFTVKPDGRQFQVLARPPAGNFQRTPRLTRFLAALNDGSDDILVIANDSNERYFDVYRMNVDTGRKTLQSLDKPGDVVRWVADRKGAVRAAVTAEKDGNTRVYWRPSDSAPWEKIGEYRLRNQSMVPVGFDGDGSLLIASNIGRDLQALYRFNPETKGLGDLLLAHPHADVGGDLIYDFRKQRVVGAAYNADKPGVAWFDDDWARAQAMVDKALPDHFNVMSRSNGPRALVFSYSDIDPGTYFLLDLDKRRLEHLIDTRRAIKPATMPTRKPVRYIARDGLPIPGWLTVPRDAVATNLPLVVRVHGGPWVHGAGWRWNDEAAFLASLGYAVLEPEFRGSAGWGVRHFQASIKQWGRAMQDDLDDGVDWLVKEGVVDPKRVCIMGASYGGYAVMMGLARNPERWRCGVNYVGVTDINLMFDVTWSDMASSVFMNSTARELLGDQVADAEQLKATSPLEQAARIRAPVLMAYGANDARVPLVHGEKMRDALLARGVPVEWVVYAGEGHGFLLEANRFDFYRRVAAFLAKNLRGPP